MDVLALGLANGKVLLNYLFFFSLKGEKKKKILRSNSGDICGIVPSAIFDTAYSKPRIERIRHVWLDGTSRRGLP